jgi:hypothetical protein
VKLCPEKGSKRKQTKKRDGILFEGEEEGLNFL